MARIRNLIYNGITVEQPIYNGIELNQWVHDGIVVWEKGSTIVTPVQISSVIAPQGWGRNIESSPLSYYSGNLYFIKSNGATSKCAYVPYNNPSATPVETWTVNDPSMMCTYNDVWQNIDASNYYCVVPWDNTLKIYDRALHPAVEGTCFLTSRGSQVNLAYYLKQKSNLQQVAFLGSDLDSEYGVGISNTEFFTLISGQHGYTKYVYDGNTYTTTEYYFSDATFEPLAYFNGYLVGISTYQYMESGAILTGQRISRVQYGSDIVESVSDLTDVGYETLVSKRADTWVYGVDCKDKQLFGILVTSVGGGIDSYCFLLDSNFNAYVTPQISSSGGTSIFSYQIIGDYIVDYANGAIYEITFPTP
ncbi:MAG: hypothetical protein IKN54_06235 [Lachnospiraceae bacterium]|nr:hypothetical protein [Lachnospiraceae bacterium]